MTEKNYRAPKGKCETFKTYWSMFRPMVTNRENFDKPHLEHLTILCDLYVDYGKLTTFVEENGYSFTTSGRYGETSRPHSEVQIRQRVLAEIRAYSKMLGLTLSTVEVSGDTNNEWTE